MKLLFVLVAFLVTSCGGDDGRRGVCGGEHATKADYLYVETKDELPTCDESFEGQLVLVKGRPDLGQCRSGQYFAVGLTPFQYDAVQTGDFNGDGCQDAVGYIDRTGDGKVY